VTGEPVPIPKNIFVGNYWQGSYALSETGAFVYLTGAPAYDKRKLIWIDRQGKADPLPLEPRIYLDPRVSPDGKWLAVLAREDTGGDIFISEVANPRLKRLTHSANITSLVEERQMCAEKSPDSSFNVRELFSLPKNTFVQISTLGYDVAPDGRFLMTLSEEDTPPQRLVVETDFFAELKRLLPSAKAYGERMAQRIDLRRASSGRPW